MKAELTSFPAKNVKSLLWSGDSLFDWVGGNAYALNGSTTTTGQGFGFRFDSAQASPSGRFVALYERLNTKGVVWDRHERSETFELNRSYYRAEIYDFPVSLFKLSDGREVVAYCPEHYNKIEIRDLSTGEVLTSRNNKLLDFFHSGLSANSQGTRLLSAGWVWGSYNDAQIYEIEAVLKNPQLLDENTTYGKLDLQGDTEVTGGVWLNEDCLALSSDVHSSDGGEDDGELRLKPNSIAVYNCSYQRYLTSVRPEAPIGTMHAIDENHVLALYDHPKIIRLNDGAVIEAWPHLYTGKQPSSVYREKLPPMAFDKAKKGFAVANDDSISILSFEA